jgi:hypothetical protein
MASHALRRFPPISHLARWLIVGFIAGAVAVLFFHQGVLAILHSLGVAPRAPFSMQATGPLGIPQVWSLAFWGGVWGVILAISLRRWDGPALVASATVFGAIMPTLAAWFVVAPLKHQPMAAGFVLSAMAIAVLVNAAWGLGTGIGLNLFGRPHLRALRTI